MLDILFLAILVAFFSLSVVFVRACERIIGPDLEGDARSDATDPADRGRAAA